ncbi:WecB/TagA/CpsF family glycosyltransferase [Klebsiella pneumoniae]|nr:WecB/TagA/CpsF family glycosyltransferase [Klebsiella pneumoniae]
MHNGIYTFINNYSYLYFRKNLDLYDNYNSIYCDGILMTKLAQMAGIEAHRVSFDMTSLAPIVFSYAQKNHKKIAIIGSDSDSNKKAISIVLEKYPNLLLVKTRHGYFKDEKERSQFVQELVELEPDIVIVGMGTPAQDIFLNDMFLTKWSGVAFTCGGFLHQTAKNGSTYYPEFFNKYNLRWLYRMIDEPKLVSRYLFGYPKSILFYLVDLLRFKFMKKF